MIQRQVQVPRMWFWTTMVVVVLRWKKAAVVLVEVGLCGMITRSASNPWRMVHLFQKKRQKINKGKRKDVHTAYSLPWFSLLCLSSAMVLSAAFNLCSATISLPSVALSYTYKNIRIAYSRYHQIHRLTFPRNIASRVRASHMVSCTKSCISLTWTDLAFNSCFKFLYLA